MNRENLDNKVDKTNVVDQVKDLDDIVEPFDPEKPDSVLFHFFLYIIKGECDTSWKLFSKYSKQKILDKTYEDMQEKDEFYLQDDITSKEALRKAFEANHGILKEAFWLPFAMNSNADYMIEFAEYKIKSQKDNKSIVEAIFNRHDGLETKLPFNMIYEDSCWRVGIIESMDENQSL